MRTPLSPLGLVALLACHGGDTAGTTAGTTPIEELPLTEGFPAFYGASPKNVLMISVDTYRKDYMSRYGEPTGMTAFMDQIAQEGVALDSHHSCSDWTFPSVVCVANGRANIEAGFIPQLSKEHRMPVPDGVTMATTLASEGYYNILITSNSWLSAGFNTNQGFAYSERPAGAGARGIYQAGRDELLRAMTRGAADRWFMHLHVKEPHVPYAPPDDYIASALSELEEIEYDITESPSHYEMTTAWASLTKDEQELVKQHLLVRYAGEMAYLDDLLTGIWIDLTSHNLLDDTLVVFWSDHGEQFWEHDYQTHAYGLNREENDAIAMFWANNIQAQAWDGPTNHTDIAPTILNVLEIDAPEEMTGYAVGQAPEDRALLGMTAARIGPLQSVMRDGMKMIYEWSTGEKTLYDRNNDYDELVDIYDSSDPTVLEFWAILEPQMEALQELLPYYTPIDPGP